MIKTVNKLADLEDKIESGELISPNDIGNNEIEFFVKHNKKVRTLTTREILEQVMLYSIFTNKDTKEYTITQSALEEIAMKYGVEVEK